MPGETTEIVATGKVSLDAVKAQLKVISLADAFPTSDVAATVTAVH
jgi:hypothetical protein